MLIDAWLLTFIIYVKKIAKKYQAEANFFIPLSRIQFTNLLSNTSISYLMRVINTND